AAAVSNQAAVRRPCRRASTREDAAAASVDRDGRYGPTPVAGLCRECNAAAVGRPGRGRVAARGSGLQELRRRRCCEATNVDRCAQEAGDVRELRPIARPRGLSDVPARETNVTPCREVVQVEPVVVTWDADRV